MTEEKIPEQSPSDVIMVVVVVVIIIAIVFAFLFYAIQGVLFHSTITSGHQVIESPFGNYKLVKVQKNVTYQEE